VNYHQYSELEGNEIINPIVLNLIVLADENVQVVVDGKVVPHITNADGANIGKGPVNSNQTSSNGMEGDGKEVASDGWPIYVFDCNYTVSNNQQKDVSYNYIDENPISDLS
jgi:hypothetical protein